jgi:DNA-binding YbaB/EbfC family protein
MMNMQQLMQQAQKMQRQIKENQEKMEKTDFEGVAGNGSVRVVMNGLYVVKSVEIRSELLDKEEIDMLQDMIVVAFNNAKGNVDAANKSSLGAMGGALGGLL